MSENVGSVIKTEKKAAFGLLSLCVLFFLSTVFQGHSQTIKLSNLFSDHMVLQRGMPVPIWGKASPNEKISLSFAGQSKSTQASEEGKWQLYLDAMEASKLGRDMKIVGNSEVVISDVLVGEVWICSGQSNMQMSVNAIPQIKALEPFSRNLRSFEVKRTVSFNEEEYVGGNWAVTNPSSAVAFSFAFFLETATDVPVGIIHASWGSSSIEAWMPRNMTAAFPYYHEIMEEFDSNTATQSKIAKILAKPNGWSRTDDIYLRRQPNILYNAMMRPLAPFAVKGLVWYQGERNTRYLAGVPAISEDNWFHRVAGMEEYGDVLSEWVRNYRRVWKNENMNFMVVMLPGYGKGVSANPDIDSVSPTAPSWAWMRESQLKVLKVPNTAVINTIDLGDVKDIHPKDKLPIGQRLALVAAKNALQNKIEPYGPIMKEVEILDQKLKVHFKHSQGLKTTDGNPPTAFWIANDAGDWKPAVAVIEGESVVLHSTEISNPLYVRYAFAGKPTVNLINEEGLPAYPFRTDKMKEQE